VTLSLPFLTFCPIIPFFVYKGRTHVGDQGGHTGPPLQFVFFQGKIDIERIMESDSYYMGLALEAAREGLVAGEVPVGAVLVDESGEVISRAFNRPIGLNDPTAHAEILVLRAGARLRGNYRLPGVSLYVTIEPCIMCLGAMLAARVRRLGFGAPDPKGGACVSLYRLPEDPRLNHRLEVTGGIREAECRELMQEFFKARR